MNLTELARRINTTPEELRAKLPELGFSIGRRAIKIDNRIAQRIMDAWSEMRRRERLAQKMEAQKTESEGGGDKTLSAEAIPVAIPAIITVRDFASRLDLPVPRVMQELMKSGILASLNERIDFDTASIIADDLGFKAVPEAEGQISQSEEQAHDRVREAVDEEKKEALMPRPPVVVVMGHVDHGKTRLLDAVRRTNVMDTEAGGITQHIGAYQVVRHDRLLTFIDTPGHEAFTVMRSRGAKVADIAILVVAVDDGVQPQTKEAINIIKSAGLPFMVALNKIDKPGANLDRVKGELSEYGLVPEDWGGQAVMVPISAKQNQNIDQLLDMLLLIADIEKERIVANPKRRAIGTVIESNVAPGEGVSATVLVQSGTLKIGDHLGVHDTQFGRVRAMYDWKGDQLTEAPPSMPVKILGWKMSPAVGDIMEVPVDFKALKKMKATDAANQATEEVAAIKHNDSAEEGGEEGLGKKYVNLIIRSDVLGSLEAILGMLDTIKHEDVGVKVVQKGLGNITDTDVLNAEAGHAILIGFNVNMTVTAENLARDKNVPFRLYNVIYKMFDDILNDLEALLPSETILTELGKLEILANFRKSDKGWIVGGRVLDGKLVPGVKLRVKRGEEYVGEGVIGELQLGRQVVKDAKAGQECGLQYQGKTKLEIGDILEAYSQEKKSRKLVIKGVSKR
ncbi:translation initiation factor IF-2 [Patescibacteria group bacterium]|nr:translation initiation factor IF-2 [Patescibacteria group bacterium]MBU1705312.1 translation initiation factor IF-2 [Patescibacteria group bacterium]